MSESWKTGWVLRNRERASFNVKRRPQNTNVKHFCRNCIIRWKVRSTKQRDEIDRMVIVLSHPQQREYHFITSFIHNNIFSDDVISPLHTPQSIVFLSTVPRQSSYPPNCSPTPNSPGLSLSPIPDRAAALPPAYNSPVPVPSSHCALHVKQKSTDSAFLRQIWIIKLGTGLLA